MTIRSVVHAVSLNGVLRSLIQSRNRQVLQRVPAGSKLLRTVVLKIPYSAPSVNRQVILRAY